ncbi:MAG: AI-2E family transporter [Myxococcota bacterium]
MSTPAHRPPEFWRRYERYPFLLAKILFFVLIALGGYALLRTVSNVLLPIVLAMLLAYVLDPAVDWFEERGFSRTTSIVLFLVLGAIVLFLLAVFLYPTISHLVARIQSGFPSLLLLAETEWIPWIEEQLEVDTPLSLRELFQDAISRSREYIPSLLQTLSDTLSAALAQVWTQTTVVVNWLVTLVLIPVLAFYFLRDFDRMKEVAVGYLPLPRRDWLLERLRRMDEVVGLWIRGQLEVALVLASMYSIGLGITFGLGEAGVSSGVAIGIFAGLLNVVPYLGFLVGFSLATLLALLDWSGWGGLVGVFLTFGVVQGIEGYIVTPRIVGDKVGLSPVAVIIALLFGAELLGLLGVLLAIPVVGSLRVLLPDLVAWYQRTEFYRGPRAEEE